MGQIYGIKNIISNKIYVGSTTTNKRRKSQHFSDLRNNRHPNKYLQSSFNKYGEDCFEWVVLEEVGNEFLADKEKCWIDCFQSDKAHKGYNLTNQPYAPMRGKKHKSSTIMKYRDGRRKGENHGNAKLNKSSILQIIALKNEGLSGKEVENKLNIDQTTISLVLCGRTWQHLSLIEEQPKRLSKSGYKGIYQVPSGRWRVEYKGSYLGTFDSIEEAISTRGNYGL
jgi:group I intron endonuclease